METKTKLSLAEVASLICDLCDAEGWVCENHPNKPWRNGYDGCDCGAGMPCPKCNDGRDLRLHDGSYLKRI